MVFVPGQSGNPKGRPAGLLAKRTLELREKARKLGCDPIEVMIYEIRDLRREAAAIKPADNSEQAQLVANETRRARRLEMIEVAAKLAPYLHPRLAQIAIDATLQGDINHIHSLDPATAAVLGKLSPEQVDVLEGVFRVIEDAAGTAEGLDESDPAGGAGPARALASSG